MKHLALLLSAVLVTSCATGNLTDRQLHLAQTGVSVAEIGLEIAEAEFLTKLANPKTPTWQMLAATRGLNLAEQELAKARVRLERVEAERAAARLAAAQQAPAIQATASK